MVSNKSLFPCLILLASLLLASAASIDDCEFASAAGTRELQSYIRWRSCYEETDITFVGPGWMTVPEVVSARHCCVECKERSECLAWTWKADGRCILKRRVPTLRRVEDGSVSGTLRWRDGYTEVETSTPAPPAPVNLDENFIPTGPPPEDDTEEEAKEPTPPPAAPASGPPTGSRSEKLATQQVGIVVGGRRLNSYLPCRNNVASSASDCSKKCVDESDCTAWTFASRFNCGWVGDSDVAGLCYLMSDSDEDSAYDAPEGDLFISGWS